MLRTSQINYYKVNLLPPPQPYSQLIIIIQLQEWKVQDKGFTSILWKLLKFVQQRVAALLFQVLVLSSIFSTRGILLSRHFLIYTLPQHCNEKWFQSISDKTFEMFLLKRDLCWLKHAKKRFFKVCIQRMLDPSLNSAKPRWGRINKDPTHNIGIPDNV